MSVWGSYILPLAARPSSRCGIGGSARLDSELQVNGLHQKRVLLDKRVDLAEFVDQLRLLRGNLILKVEHGIAEVSLLLLILRQVNVQQPDGWISEILQIAGKVIGKSGGRNILKKIRHPRGIGGKCGRESAAVDAESAIIVRSDAQRVEVAENTLLAD